jgi:hypothetical protein
MIVPIRNSDYDALQEYRASGEKLHTSGKHAESVVILQSAVDILGID